jgi:hypothetical protein
VHERLACATQAIGQQGQGPQQDAKPRWQQRRVAGRHGKGADTEQDEQRGEHEGGLGHGSGIEVFRCGHGRARLSQAGWGQRHWGDARTPFEADLRQIKPSLQRLREH